jgi:hypothetical protein
MIDQGVQ